MNKGNKYYPLYLYLRRSGESEVKLSFREIEAIIDAPLPKSASTQRGWWSNRHHGIAQAGAWMAAGYIVDELDVAQQTVVFRRPGQVYHVERDGDTLIWDAQLIKALRYHMGITQTELAEQMGVRQSTVSEWETGSYIPRRTSAKLLSVIAERADFPYH